MAFKPVHQQAVKKGAQPKGAKPPAPSRLSKDRKILEEERTYRKGIASLRDFIAPAAFQVEASYVRMSGKFARTLFVLGYPRYIQVGWFAPIINFSASFDISIYFAPLDTPLVLKQLRDKVGRVQAEIAAGQEKGKPRDPVAETALRDMEKLRDDLTQGIEHFFSVGVYITIYADTLEQLDKHTEDLESIFGTKLVFTKRVYYQAEQGFNSTLPLCSDELQIGFNMNTSPAAAAFPFISSDLTSDDGILYGINRHNNSLILFDRFSMQNANEVVFATSGAGKSINFSTPVLLKDAQGIHMVAVGEYIEHLGAVRKFELIDEELEGVVEPDIEVYTFDKALKGAWSPVSIAARKIAPQDEYVFHLASGREITVTADHNMLVLRDGNVVTAKSAGIHEGECVPLPTHVPEPNNPIDVINVYNLLADNQRIYVDGAQKLLRTHKVFLKTQAIDERYDRYLATYCKRKLIPLRYLTKIISLLREKVPPTFQTAIQLCSKQGRSDTRIPTHIFLSPELARLMGYIVSEGTIGERYVLISQEQGEVFQDIKKCLQMLGIPYANRSGSDKTFVISARAWVEFFKAIGLKGKSGTKRVPGIFFNASGVLVAEFLRAYFEGDGGVERHSVTATSKSKRLISDLTYLLLRFGIVARLARRKKHATNSSAHGIYELLTISGQEFLSRFEEHIGFVSQRKNASLAGILGKEGNTNVWTIPVQTVFQELSHLFSYQLRGIQDVIELKNGSYQPSRQKLQNVIRQLEEQAKHFIEFKRDIQILEKLPLLDTLVTVGSERVQNAALWSELGQSWRLMKNGEVHPRAHNVFRAASVVWNTRYDLYQIKKVVKRGFYELGLFEKDFGRSFQDALWEEHADMDYARLSQAAHTVVETYDHYAQRIPRIQALIAKLRKLADADLLWDPITSIEKKESAHPYVYDLTVDNEVFLAGHGGMYVHNSFAIKLEVLRSLMLGVDVIIIDPEREYQHLCEAVGGTYVNISLSSQSRINPFDLPRPVGEQVAVADIIRSAVITLKGLLRLMLGVFNQEEDSIMDRALIETYAKKDITADSDLTKVEPPIMKDLQEVLAGMEGAHSLSEKLRKYTEGTFSGLINHATNVQVDNQLVVFSVRDLEDELRPIAIYTIVNYIWNIVRSELKKRILVIDEAWWLMQHEDSARFIFALAKRCRKYYLGLTTITQDVNDFLNSEYGKAILTNSAIQLLLKQSTAAIDLVQKTFMLTEGEKYLLLENAPGEGIFFAGSKHVAIKVIASYAEDQLITTDPRQLLEIEEAKKELAESTDKPPEFSAPQE